MAHLHLGDLSAFVIATQNSDPITVAHFQRNEQSDGLNRVVASVDVVTHEQVVGVWGLAAEAEQLLQVMELTVDVAANRHRRFYLRHV